VVSFKTPPLYAPPPPEKTLTVPIGGGLDPRVGADNVKKKQGITSKIMYEAYESQ
jgi:hypothetical protein